MTLAIELASIAVAGLDTIVNLEFNRARLCLLGYVTVLFLQHVHQLHPRVDSVQELLFRSNNHMYHHINNNLRKQYQMSGSH